MTTAARSKAAWRGIVEEYRDRLGIPADAAAVTLGEGATPLVHAPHLSTLLQGEVWLKVEGANPTGSFKDRGMAAAMTVAAHHGAKAVVCASTGNTSASASAYAARLGIPAIVLLPAGKVAAGKLGQALVTGAKILEVEGSFDDCLHLAQSLAERYPVELVNSVNPVRIAGQKTAAYEIVEALGGAPDIHALPVGNAGNITAYWAGYLEEDDLQQSGRPRMLGFQAAGAAPFTVGRPVREPETIATAIRIGNPASWEKAIRARDDSRGMIGAVPDREILEAYRLLATREGVFVEPSSATGIAGLIALARSGELAPGQRIAVTVTGNGLKDPEWATGEAPTRVAADPAAVADLVDLD